MSNNHKGHGGIVCTTKALKQYIDLKKCGLDKESQYKSSTTTLAFLGIILLCPIEVGLIQKSRFK